MTEIVDPAQRVDWTVVQRKRYHLYAKQIDEAWEHMEMFANIYSAFANKLAHI